MTHPVYIYIYMIKNFDLFSGHDQINVTNDNTFVSNIDMINQFPCNQHRDPNNIANSHLDLDTESDFSYNNSQTVISNKNLKISELDQTESSRKPRIIENKKCKINMNILPKCMTPAIADISFNTSILEEFSELSDINISDIHISDINITDTNNNKEMINEIQTETESISTAVYGDTELDTTLVTLCDLNEVKSSIAKNNCELYYNSQIANVSQNTGTHSICRVSHFNQYEQLSRKVSEISKNVSDESCMVRDHYLRYLGTRVNVLFVPNKGQFDFF